MRILHFGGFYNDRFAGLERHIDHLRRGLQSHCESGSPGVHDRYAATQVNGEGYIVYKVPSLGKLAGKQIREIEELLDTPYLGAGRGQALRDDHVRSSITEWAEK
ncbi:MAG: hypothetical protein M0Z36_05145 [Thermaerobacter sp.]|jgi:hypothetical protein|nr:hypothetical protein [Thermaerobacter sp.]